MNEERGSQLFSEAIRHLEDGDWSRSEQLFIGVLNNLDNKHHLTILSLKSLVTICTNRGDLEKAIEWSLKLLDSQTAALGYGHADTSRTVTNISTMCETLGKHDLAKEVKQLHHYASAAEKTSKAHQVRGLRDKGKDEPEPEDTTQDEQHKSAGELIASQLEMMRTIGEGAPGAVIVTLFLILIGIGAGTLIGLKLVYSSDNVAKALAKTNAEFATVDDRLALKYYTPEAPPKGAKGPKPDLSPKVVVSVDGKDKVMPYGAYGYNIMELGELFFASPFDKEYWLTFAPDGVVDGEGRAFYRKTHHDRGIIAQATALAESCNLYFKKEKEYPNKLTEVGDFTYKNPYTLRKDYPLIQTISIPGHTNADAFIGTLMRGAFWPTETAPYPGCINCAHLSSRTNMSVPESFFIHALNGRGQYFTQSDGKPFLIALQKGSQVLPSNWPLNPLKGVSKVYFLDVSPAYSGLLGYLISMRWALLCACYMIFFFLIARIFTDENIHKIAKVFSILFFLAAIGFGVLNKYL